MEERLYVGVINHSGRPVRMRTDIADKAIPAAETTMISVIGSHFAEVYDAGDEREVRIAIVPDDYSNHK